MENAAQLLDLLASADAEDIEPTKAAGGRQLLYSEVHCIAQSMHDLTHSVVSPFCYPCWWYQSWGIAPRSFQCEPVQLSGG